MMRLPRLEERPSVARLYRLQFEPAQDGWVLLYPEGMVKLNATAAEILRRCDGNASVEQLITGLERDFAPADLRADVHYFLQDAYERGWLV
jgi:pyrroloquinoline quinone biosynthesis protein D